MEGADMLARSKKGRTAQQRSALWGTLLFASAVACAAQSEPDTTNEPQGNGAAGTQAGSGGTASQSGGASLGGGGAALTGAGTTQGGSAPQSGSAGQASAGTPAAGGVSTSGGAAAGGVSAGGSSVGGGAGASIGGASACPTTPVAAGSMPLIDDFNHLGRNIPNNEGRSGVWDVWTLSPTAEMSPKSANYQTTGADMGNGYTHWTGTNIGGTDDWGPTLTVQLNAGCPYDASVYSGLAFKLKGTATKMSGGGSSAVPLKVMLWQPPGVPAKDAKGGTCTAVACYNHFFTFVNVPASWDTPVSVPFTSLMQGTWTGTMPFVWNPQQLIAVQFQVEIDGSKSELTTFDLSFDDLMFAK
jgi:hypothetical protein